MAATRSVDDGRSVALVTTTIHVPRCIEAYLENAERHGHGDRLSVVVVGDRKTPAEAAAYLEKLDGAHRARIRYIDVDAQKKLLRNWPALDQVIRWNCIQRRNVGYLQAALDGAEVIIAFDDDNFVTDDDYIGSHLVVGREVEMPVVRHASGWWNVCERLECDPPRSFYHRGYPKSRQDFTTGGHETRSEEVRVAVNAGLWLRNPDVDATANIEEPLNVVSMRPVDGSPRCALGPGTWCPFNSQNTAFDVSTLPAMYLVMMLDSLRGYRIGRLDDIWMSYFIRAIGDRLGQSVVYGDPLVIQDRNPHDFVVDLSQELGGYVLTETIVRYLRDFETTETTWAGAYLDLIHHLRERSEGDEALELPEREYLRNMAIGMAAWYEATTDILGVR